MRPASRRGLLGPFFAAMYVDYFSLVNVQHGPADQSVLVASASLASDHVRLFGKEEGRETPILAPKKSTD